MHHNYNKKHGFTLAEIVIALFIVAMVTFLSGAIIKRQLTKIDEYAYYMTFRSLQNMASQIAVWGDKEESPIYTSFLPDNYLANNIKENKLSKHLNSFTKKLFGSEKYIFSSLFPKAIAADECPDYCTDSYGYYNMENADDTSCSGAFVQDCVCQEGYTLSFNNERVCCFASSSPSADAKCYAYQTNAGTYDFKWCKTDFNPTTNECCPDHSVYNAQDGECQCLQFYQKESGNCVASSCPRGYELDSSTMSCIKNPPILKAKKFCELIYENWNVKSGTDNESCDTFTEIDSKGIHYYKDLYEAILGAADDTGIEVVTGDDGLTPVSPSSQTLFATNSKKGAFKDIPPNVILSNGVKLWILGDKSASIPGLSDVPELPSSVDFSINHTRNLCVNLKKTDETECNNADGYYCSNGEDNNCYGFYNETITTRMGDARACCAVPNLTDIQESETAEKPFNKDVRYLAIGGFTVLADINGDRGSSTLWEDVYPFFISSNGKVYPGYPLDGARAELNDNPNGYYLGGNNDKFLPTDVYYYSVTDDGSARKKMIAFSGVSYARALCSAGEIPPYTPYCKNLDNKFNGGKFKYLKSDGTVEELSIGSGNGYLYEGNNPCNYYKCFISLRRKLKVF